MVMMLCALVPSCGKTSGLPEKAGRDRPARQITYGPLGDRSLPLDISSVNLCVLCGKKQTVRILALERFG